MELGCVFTQKGQLPYLFRAVHIVAGVDPRPAPINLKIKAAKGRGRTVCGVRQSRQLWSVGQAGESLTNKVEAGQTAIHIEAGDTQAVEGQGQGQQRRRRRRSSSSSGGGGGKQAT
jgi:hypothetical protein